MVSCSKRGSSGFGQDIKDVHVSLLRVTALAARVECVRLGVAPQRRHAKGSRMADFHVQLALDYFRAKSTHERTEDALVGLVAHVA